MITIPNVKTLDWKPIPGYPLEFAVEPTYVESVFPLKVAERDAYVRCIGSNKVYAYSSNTWYTLRDLCPDLDVSIHENLIEALLRFECELGKEVDVYVRPRLEF